MKSPRWLVFASTMLLTVASVEAQRPSQPQVVRVQGAAIIAFFPPPEATDAADGDADEALSDFLFYAEKIRSPLNKAGISFQVIYARSFRVHLATGATLFHPRNDFGYYLISPGKNPLVEYGVTTDSDLLLVARRYFGPTGFGK
jgi:hypothetical protein